MNKKGIFIAVISTIFIGVLIGVYFYFKPASVSSTGEADFNKDMGVWLQELDKDTSASKNFATYINKSVRFDAEILDITGDSSVTLQLGNSQNAWPMEVYANFDASMKSELAGLLVGDQITIQCVCNGLEIPSSTVSDDPAMALLDEVSGKQMKLSRCAIIEHKPVKPDVSTSHEHETDSTSNH